MHRRPWLAVLLVCAVLSSGCAQSPVEPILTTPPAATPIDNTAAEIRDDHFSLAGNFSNFSSEKILEWPTSQVQYLAISTSAQLTAGLLNATVTDELGRIVYAFSIQGGSGGSASGSQMQPKLPAKWLVRVQFENATGALDIRMEA